MKKGKSRNCEAYFTVEAALVLPLVMSAMLLGCYLFCFQYDRCLLEQDMGSMTVWCSRAASGNAGDARELKSKIEERMDEIYRDKYVAWEFTLMNVDLNHNNFSVNGSGQLIFPVPGWNFWNDSNIWSTEREYKSQRLSPVFMIRQFRKMGNIFGQEDQDGGAAQDGSG